jgi:hypothetical protein
MVGDVNDATDPVELRKTAKLMRLRGRARKLLQQKREPLWSGSLCCEFVRSQVQKLIFAPVMTSWKLSSDVLPLGAPAGVVRPVCP